MNRTLLKRVLVILAILISGLATYITGQSLGWWRLPTIKVVVAMVALAITFLLLLPVFDASEHLNSLHPMTYWLLMLLIFILTGIITALILD